MKVDNNTPAINAEADLTAMGADGFSLNWTTNDAVATQILYLSLAPLAVTEVRLISFTASRESQGVHLRVAHRLRSQQPGLPSLSGDRWTTHARHAIARRGIRSDRRRAKPRDVRAELQLLGSRRAAQSPQAVYWLEDVDFNGKSTWHGPVTPGGALARPGEPLAGDSPLLAGLGRGVGHREERFSASPESEPRLNEAEPLVRRQMSMSMSASAPISIQAAAAAEQARQAQWAIASQPAVKMGVRVSGWYRVGQPALAAAGLPGSVDPAMLRLYLDGVEQPMKVTGAGDGQFNPADAIEFYGTGVDTPYTDTAVYWLTWGTGTGLRVQDAPPASPGPAGAPRFWGTVERKDRSVYFAALRNGSAENWFGELIAPDAESRCGRDRERAPPRRRPRRAPRCSKSLSRASRSHPILSAIRSQSVSTARHVGTVTFEGRNLGSATLTVAPQSHPRRGERRPAGSARRRSRFQPVRHAAPELLAHEPGRRQRAGADRRRPAHGDDRRLHRQPDPRRRHHGHGGPDRVAGDRRVRPDRSTSRRQARVRGRCSRSPTRRSRRRCSSPRISRRRSTR